MILTEVSVSEQYCKKLVDKNADIPEACKRFESIKAELNKKLAAADPFAGMGAGASTQTRNAKIMRRMSTRHTQGKDGKKSSWF